MTTPRRHPPNSSNRMPASPFRKVLRYPHGLSEKRLPAGRYARTTHVGPYTELGDTWSRFMGEWLPKSGHRVGDGSSFEVYRNTPENAAPNELCTDLYLPIT